LDRAHNGETIEVTDRGTPVAVLMPLPEERRALAELIASGVVKPAKRPWQPGRRLREVPPGAPSPSEVLAAMRAEEH